MNSFFPIKVAHVVYNLTIGGVTNVVNQLLKQKHPGVEQVLILLCDDEAATELTDVKTYRLNYKPAEVYSLKGFAKLSFFPQPNFQSIANKIEEIYRKENFTIFHFHGIPKDLPIGTLLQKRDPAIKLVYTDHLMRITQQDYNSIKGKALAWIYKRFYKAYNIIFVSKATYEAGVVFGFVNSKRQNSVIENSINLSVVKKKPSYTISQKPTIVYVSRISAVKGHFLLIEVTRLLKEKYDLPEFEFIIIGPDELNGKLQHEINKNLLTDHFKFLGPRNDIYDLLYAYDIGVFPSEREGLPIALLEKMAAGLPVAASNIPEIKNVIQKDNEALLFPVNNAEACAEQLYRLIKDPALRERIGKAGRKAVEERYSQPLLEKYIGFYEQLLKQ